MWKFYALLTLVVSVGCASGPTHAQLEDQIPPIPRGKGRIFIYRTSAFGFAVQPPVRLNGTSVGKSVPSGFFFVDRSPGSYEVRCTTEAPEKVTFTLSAGESVYIKTTVTWGMWVGHVNPTLVDPEVGKKDLKRCSYTGEEWTPRKPD